MVETQFFSKIKALQSDWGMNINPFQLIYIILVLNIKFLVLTLHNKMVVLKEKNHHVVEMGIILFTHCHVPLSFQPFAFQTSIFLINRLLTLALSNSTLYEFHHKKTSNMIFSRASITLVINFYALVINTNWNIIQLNVFSLDVVPITRVLCLHKLIGHVYVTRHVVFNECHFFFMIFLFLQLLQPILCHLLSFVPLSLLL